MFTNSHLMIGDTPPLETIGFQVWSFSLQKNATCENLTMFNYLADVLFDLVKQQNATPVKSHKFDFPGMTFSKICFANLRKKTPPPGT